MNDNNYLKTKQWDKHWKTIKKLRQMENPTGYCVKCKAKKEMVEHELVVMKNKREAVKGKCPDCSTGMFKILGKNHNYAGPNS